jgi:2-methylcitrate dehydratase PrpD
MGTTDASAEVSPEDRIAAFVADCSFEDLPETAVESVTRAFVDTVGVSVAGRETPVGRATETAAGDGETDGSPAERALYLGAVGHALDYDDLSWGIDGHPSVVLVPPILALAETEPVSGRDAITAYAAGFEAACAVAEPISPDHYERGWHATATFGALGAAAAAANLLDLDAEATRRALTIAASTPAGLKRNFGSMTKPLHAGFASRSGVTAATLAAEGVTADAEAISGDRGFWDLYGEGADSAPPIGEAWALETEGIHVKMYPCCYFTHTSIAAAQSLVEDEGLTPEDVESVSVSAAQGAADALQHQTPETGLEAKFSMEYTVASGIVRDRVGLDAFEDDAVDDPAVEAVRQRVEFATDDDLPYDSHEATVAIETADGRHAITRTDPPGVHSDPPSAGELRAKFTDCATRAVSESRATRLFDDLAALSDLSRLDDVTDAL